MFQSFDKIIDVVKKLKEVNFSNMYDVLMPCGYQRGKLVDIYQAKQIEHHLMPCCSCSCWCNQERCINDALFFYDFHISKVLIPAGRWTYSKLPEKLYMLSVFKVIHPKMIFVIHTFLLS